MEPRAAPRIALMLRVGKLRMPQGEFLCVVRDASASGIKVKLFHSLPHRGSCELELGTGDCYAVEWVWEQDGHAGFRFASGTVDLSALIDESTPHPRRHLRLRLDRPVTLIAQDQRCDTIMRDISQHGALVEFDSRLPLGLKVQLECNDLPNLEGRIRWRLSRAHGVVFQRSFRLDELAILAEQIQVGGRASLPPA
jgi:hypothetical protein